MSTSYFSSSTYSASENNVVEIKIKIKLMEISIHLFYTFRIWLHLFK